MISNLSTSYVGNIQDYYTLSQKKHPQAQTHMWEFLFSATNPLSKQSVTKVEKVDGQKFEGRPPLERAKSEKELLNLPRETLDCNTHMKIVQILYDWALV